MSAEKKNHLAYRIAVEWSEADQVYVARVPAFEACGAHGDTPAQAVQEVTVALELLLETALAHRRRLPAPDVAVDRSGEHSLRTPRSPHKRQSRLATAKTKRTT